MQKVLQINRRQRRQHQKDNLEIAYNIEAKSEAQRQAIYSYRMGNHILMTGSAGTGKTWLSTALALESLFNKEYDKILFVRSAVQVRAIGFTPGTEQEKALVYALPYKHIVNEICQNGTAWDILTKKGSIEFITTSFIRGLTLDNTLIIFDEFQNTDKEEIESVLTRVGINSRILICGDVRQSDLHRRREQSGVEWLARLAEQPRMKRWLDTVTFTPMDIVRSEFCKDLLMSIEEM